MTMLDILDNMTTCFAELDYLCSEIMNKEIESKYNIFSAKIDRTYYEFSKFRESVNDYRFKLEEFNNNKEWNLKNQCNRQMLTYLDEFRENAEKSLINIDHILKLSVYIQFKHELILSIATLIRSINGYLTNIRRFLKENCSEFEYNNLITSFNLSNLNFNPNQYN